jgi:hypothetical protein
MIAASRAYIRQQIQKCNADYKEIEDPWNDDDMALSQIDRHYKLLFSTLSTEAVGNYHTDLVDCSLELYKKAGFNELSDFDEIYDLAINVKNTVLDPLFVKNSDAFSDIIFLGIAPEPLPTNDKVFKILLTFQIRKDFDFQGA